MSGEKRDSKRPRPLVRGGMTGEVRPSFRNSTSRVLIKVAVQIPFSNLYSYPEPNLKKL